MNQKTTELQKNELADWVEQKLGGLKPHSNMILLVVLAVLLLLLVGGFWYNARENARSLPWRALQSAQISHDLTGQTSEFEQVYENFPDSMASLWALQISGDADLAGGLSKLVTDREGALKQIDRARKSLEKIRESTLPAIPDLLQERSLFSLAYAYESLGRFEDATRVFQRLVDEHPDASIAIQVREALARLADPAFTAAFEKFASVGTAPGMKLPAIPDISFPAGDSADAGGNSGG